MRLCSYKNGGYSVNNIARLSTFFVDNRGHDFLPPLTSSATEGPDEKQGTNKYSICPGSVTGISPAAQESALS